MPRPYFIDNQWLYSETTRIVHNPYNEEPLDSICLLEADQIESLVKSSQQAFEETRKLPSHHRAQLLENIAQGIEKERETLTNLLILEAGKPLRYASGEVTRSILTFRIAGEEAKRIGGEVIPLDLNELSEGRFGLTRRFPVGPILGITPFNFPLNLVAHKIGPALAAGNSITIKPASQTPLTALKLAEIILAAGCLPGQVNIVPADQKVAEQLVRNPAYKMLSFTGSDSIGWYLKSLIPERKVALELGGNAGLIIDKDCDLEQAATRAVTGSFAYAGQVCISVQRIFALRSIFESFKQLFLEKMAAIGVGDPHQADTVVGPLINAQATRRVADWVQEAREQGAEIVTGGAHQGNLFQPTLITSTSPQMKVCSEELFAPVATLDSVDDFTEAIVRVNESRYGLQAGVFTNNYQHALQAFNEIETGGVIINDYPTYRIDNMPYGGVKSSGFGREGLKYAIEEMTELRLLVLAP
jgi:glyceraldehyde-3-phosphate dehydrogenase (NADP+)